MSYGAASLTVFHVTLISILILSDGRGVFEQMGLHVSGSAHSDPPPPASIIQQQGQPAQTLRVCNAFAHAKAVDVVWVKDHSKMGNLQYKQCQDFNLVLSQGDQLDFQVGDMLLGTFAVSQPPADGSHTLLLIVHRRSGSSMAAAFKSHAFLEDAQNSAQVAVIDTFQGTKADDGDTVNIMNSDPNSTQAPEQLPLNSVVAITPGSYVLAMTRDHESAKSQAKQSSVALNAEKQGSYVVFRVGDAMPKGHPEEIVVFPQAGEAQKSAGAVLLVATLLMAHFMHT